MIVFRIPESIRGKILTLTISLPVVLACLHTEKKSQWMQIGTAPNQQPHDAIKQFSTSPGSCNFLDLKKVPQYIFGCYIIPCLRGVDLHNLILTAKSLYCDLQEELPFFFKGKQREEQLRQYLASPKCLIPIAVMSIRQYMLTKYPSIIGAGSVALPSIPTKKIGQIDLLAIKSKLFVQFLDKFQDSITPMDGKMFCSIASDSYHHPSPPTLLTYIKTRLLTPVYNYLSLSTILKALHIPEDAQARDCAQRAIYTHFSVLASLQDAYAEDKQRQLAQQLLHDILAAGGESWLSRFDFAQTAVCYGNVFLNYEAAYGYTEVSRRLIGFGADINQGDREGRTPLHYAARHGHLGAAKFLLENRADIDYLDELEQTPLHYACMSNRLEVARFLLTKGANVRIRNMHNDSVLHMTVQANAPDLAQLLIEYGANTNARAYFGRTPLHRIVNAANRHSLTDMLRLLVANKADINAQDNYGHTPLADALCYKFDLELAKLLVAYGADVNTPHPTKGSLRKWAEYNLEKTQNLIWHDIMGAPPYDNERAKYLLLIARKDGVMCSFHPLPHPLSCRQFTGVPYLMRSIPPTPPPLTISPQDTFSVLSRRSHTHIKQVFGETVLSDIKWACLYKSTVELIEQSAAM